MIFNQLNARLTPDTLVYLSNAMSGSPLELGLENYRVEIITSLNAITAVPENHYKAHSLNVRVWYDAFLERSSLILSLESSDLLKRALELNELGILREGMNYYNPHLVLRKDMPPLSRHYRRFILQTANLLCANEKPLYLCDEYVTQVDLLAPLNMEYNAAMFAERSHRRNV